MDFIDSEILIWDKPTSEKMIIEPGSAQEMIFGSTGEVEIQNPPEYFSLRGKRYKFKNQSKHTVGGNKCGETFYLVESDGMLVWVSEQHEGEFIDVLIPREMKDSKFII